MTRWIRNRPTRREDTLAGVAAAGVGVAVGLTVFYLARLLMSREALEPAATEDGAPKQIDRPDQKLLGPEV